MGRSAVGVIIILALALLAVPLASKAQQAGKVLRLGVLVPAEPPSPVESNLATFRHSLRDLGYVEGQTIAVEYRICAVWLAIPAGRPSPLPCLALGT